MPTKLNRNIQEMKIPQLTYDQKYKNPSTSNIKSSRFNIGKCGVRTCVNTVIKRTSKFNIVLMAKAATKR